MFLHALFVGEKVVGGGEPAVGAGVAGIFGDGLEERCEGFFGGAFLEEKSAFVGFDIGAVASGGDVVELFAGAFEVVLLDGEIDGEEAGALGVGVEVEDFVDGLGAVLGVVGGEEDFGFGEFGGPVGLVFAFDLAELEEDGAVFFAADAGEDAGAFEGDGELGGDGGVVGEIAFGEGEHFSVDGGGGGILGVFLESAGVGRVDGEEFGVEGFELGVGIDEAFEEIAGFAVAAALEEGFGAEADDARGGALRVGEGVEEIVEAGEVFFAALAEDGFKVAFDEFLVLRVFGEEFLVMGFGFGVLAEEEEFFGADFGGVPGLIDEFGPEALLGGAGGFLQIADEGEVADGVADVVGVGFLFVGGVAVGFGWVVGFGRFVGLGVEEGAGRRRVARRAATVSALFRLRNILEAPSGCIFDFLFSIFDCGHFHLGDAAVVDPPF